MTQFGVGAGPTHKVVAANPSNGHNGNSVSDPGTVASLSMEFAYICLKNAESLLPTAGENQTVFCEGVGYIGNPITWSEVEQLRMAIITCQAYTGRVVVEIFWKGNGKSDRELNFNTCQFLNFQWD